MSRSVRFHLGLSLVTVSTALLLASPVRAEEEDSKEKKGVEDKKPAVIQIDLNKLPPTLAKQLLKYVQDEEKKGPAKGKPTTEPKKGDFGKFVQSQLAKGLRGTELAAAIHKEQTRRGMKDAGRKKHPGDKKKKGGDDEDDAEEEEAAH